MPTVYLLKFFQQPLNYNIHNWTVVIKPLLEPGRGFIIF